MRISDWSSDVCSSDLVEHARDRKRITASPSRADGAVRALRAVVNYLRAERDLDLPDVARKINAANGWGKVARRRRALTGEEIGRAACRESVWQYVWISVVADTFKQTCELQCGCTI